MQGAVVSATLTVAGNARSAHHQSELCIES